VVVPLSAANFIAKFTVASFLSNLAAMLLFGLIIAFCGRETINDAIRFTESRLQ
jgi:ABC-type xylose transport system permease subunit